MAGASPSEPSSEASPAAEVAAGESPSLPAPVQPPLAEAAPLPPRGASPDEVDAAVQSRLHALEKRIGVTFRRPELLLEAMTHASWNNERGRPSGPGHDNERLEYLGDAVLELVVGEYLFKRFPNDDEGRLTQVRAALVNTISLARMAEKLGMGDTLLLGRGAVKTGASRLPSLLANAFEAMIGATFLDQGYRVTVRVFLQTLGDLEDWTDQNHKGRLQEAAQEKLGQTPHYRATASGGPGHRREYVAEAVIGGQVYGTGRGSTKQAAEQDAARAGLEGLRSGPGPRPAPTVQVPTASPRTRRRAVEAATEAAVEGVTGEEAGTRRRRRATEVAVEEAVLREAGAGRSSRRRRSSGQPTPVAPPAPRADPEAAAVRASSPVVPAAAPVAPGGPTPVVRAAPIVPATPLPAAPRRRGILSVLRSAAEAIVGRAPSGLEAVELGAPVRELPPSPEPTVTVDVPRVAEPPTTVEVSEAEGAAPPRPRTRRGRRGGRGRRRAAPDTDGAEAAATPTPEGTPDREPGRPRRRRPAAASAEDTPAGAPAAAVAAEPGASRPRPSSRRQASPAPINEAPAQPAQSRRSRRPAPPAVPESRPPLQTGASAPRRRRPAATEPVPSPPQPDAAAPRQRRQTPTAGAAPAATASTARRRRSDAAAAAPAAPAAAPPGARPRRPRTRRPAGGEPPG